MEATDCVCDAAASNVKCDCQRGPGVSTQCQELIFSYIFKIIVTVGFDFGRGKLIKFLTSDVTTNKQWMHCG